MLAIMGGTGLYALSTMEVLETVAANTPFGAPSAPLVRGRWQGQELIFLARHGLEHRFLPHEINYRANIYALKSLGATAVISLSAVGSLKPNIAPGDLVLPHQYIDWTRGRRANTFFGEGLSAHISTAEPVSASLVQWLAKSCAQQKRTCHPNLIYVCVEGPRLGTRAESRLMQNFGGDVVGMTNVPEAFLAREAQMGYASLGIVTDFDCWMEDPNAHVRATEIFALYQQSLTHAINVVAHALTTRLPTIETDIRTALSTAILTPDEHIPESARPWLAVLRA